MKKLFVILLVIGGACSKPLPTIDNVDLTQWKADKNGCNHFREKTIDNLVSQKNKLKSLSEDEIISLLGRPDQNELYKRNEKFFYYFLKPGPTCARDSSEIKLSIRFNAVGLAKEIVIIKIN